ncbi:MAG TPA: CYTH domain-containing protein [Bacteroidales bacterium]|nr:CYTH domain-containing protein [Bacteroidales bacterium]
MATETERKFLVKGEFINLAVKKIDIIQRYISIDSEKSIRLRIYGEDAFMTIKSRLEGKSISRNEWEFRIPLQDAREMMKVCLPGVIEKTRYIIPSGIHKYEVDVFHGKNNGLVIAEIELSDENEGFEKPEWIGEEVTGRPEYYNANLLK